MTSALPWRIIRDGSNSLAWNMAQDEAHLQAVANDAVAPTLRLYRCADPAISLGRFQSIERSVNAAACSQMGISLVRRITGGRGIVHGDDLIVSVIATLDSLGCADTGSRAILPIYERLSACYIQMFSRVGIDVRSGGHRLVEGRAGRHDRRGNCLDLVTRADIVDCATGAKLLGAALCCHGNVILQQASIPLRSNERRQYADRIAIEVFGSRKDAQPLVALGADDLAHALIEIWQSQFVCNPDSAHPSEAERHTARRLLSERYLDERWTHSGEMPQV